MNLESTWVARWAAFFTGAGFPDVLQDDIVNAFFSVLSPMQVYMYKMI